MQLYFIHKSPCTGAVCATGRQLAAMGGTRWGCTRGDGEQCPQDLRQAKLDAPTWGKHPEWRAILAWGPSAPPFSLAYLQLSS